MFISVAVFLFGFALFCWLIKSSLASWLSAIPVSVSHQKSPGVQDYTDLARENVRLLHTSLKVKFQSL